MPELRAVLGAGFIVCSRSKLFLGWWFHVVFHVVSQRFFLSLMPFGKSKFLDGIKTNCFGKGGKHQQVDLHHD